MSPNPVESALRQIARDLERLDQEWALVGGLAVSARATPRTTRDIDLAVSMRTDREAEKLVFDLRAFGYGCSSPGPTL